MLFEVSTVRVTSYSFRGVKYRSTKFTKSANKLMQIQILPRQLICESFQLIFVQKPVLAKVKYVYDYLKLYRNINVTEAG